MNKAMLLVAISVLISSCGVVAQYQALQLSADELATKSDQYVCNAANKFAVLEGKLPALWIRELKRRDLIECMAAVYRGKTNAPGW